MKTTSKTLFFTLLLSALAAPLGAQGTYTAASCNQGDVNAVINGPTHTAVDGDVIQIPSGSCTWSSGITVPSGIGITIQGNGSPDSSPATHGASSSCSRGTTITISGTAFSASPTYGNSTMRLSCMDIQAGATSAIVFVIDGTCASSGCTNLRIDNLTVRGFQGNASHPLNSFGISAVNDMFGVVDHNTINVSPAGYQHFIEVGHDSYLGVGKYGDNSWHLPENWGSANFLFMENNLFNEVGCCESETALVGDGGARIVLRFNQFNNGWNAALAWHGTESNGRPRGGRAFEFYKNTYTSPAGSSTDIVVAPRSGNGLVWGNTVNHSGASLNHFLKLQTFRAAGPGSSQFGGCDGSSPYDANDGGGSYSTIYYTATIQTVSGNVVTVSGNPGWTTNQWAPTGANYSMHDTSAVLNGYHPGTEIIANGSNTLTLNDWDAEGPGSYDPNCGGGFCWKPNVGDSIQLLRATSCIDQNGGRGAGILYSGDFPPSPAAPSNEVLSASYVWSNTITGGAPNFGYTVSAMARVIRNRDFYVDNLNQSAQTTPTSPFDGTTIIGMGYGILGNRPTTCTTGVAYWATDQGSWNKSGSGGQGQLYTCTAPNTWTLSYTPYTFPHPLITGGTTNPPAPPTNVKAVVD